MNIKNYQIEYHPSSKSDLDEAYFWYEQQLKGLGDKFLWHAIQKLAQIVAMPEVYGVKSKKQYREAKVDKFPYLITYKIIAEKHIIFISSIQHEKRNPDKRYRDVLDR